jgi:AmpD protein
MDIVAGWLSAARRVPSPNFNARPEQAEIELIVLHNISLPPGVFTGDAIEAFFCNVLDSHAHPYFASICDLRVSAHFLIRRSGELVQFVSTDCRAWHAGASSWGERVNCNDFSVGIELEGTDDLPYTDDQYRALIPLIRALRARYPGIAEGAICGHSDIAPNRKTDPGPAFDWQRLWAMLGTTL